jgi:hypothetical protein
MSDFDDKKIAYLGIVQNTIDRMSANSAILKGFAATVITGVSAISFTEISKWVLLLSMLPVISFFALDVYYLVLERKFRFLYNNIREDERIIDFSLNVDVPRDKLSQSNTRLRDCLCSPSIWLFYCPAIFVVLIITIMKFGGCI